MVGASLAYELGRQRARVTLLAKAPQLTTVTANSFAWLTTGYGQDEAIVAFRQAALREWHRVEQELSGRLAIEWSGALRWFTDSPATERFANRLLTAGYPVHLLSPAQVRALEPHLKAVPAHALFAPEEGALDARRATEVLLQAAQAAGATVQLGNEVRALLTSDSRVTGVMTTTGPLRADLVVLAAGVTSAELVQSLGLTLPLAASPAILLRLHTPHRFVQRVVSTPEWEIRAASPTQLLAAADYVAASGANSPSAIAQRTLRNLQAQWRRTEHLRLEQVAVGQRPMPRDGLPIVGHVAGVDGLYLAGMHAGVTLAVLVGRLAATEIVRQQEQALLAPYRLTRFA
ncbi:NAD(P)/FAD-dependent oxidoreductase [Hymenobacter sp. BRD67]|uniref:NAD(P)/FAD-dependent oxidoreductase n=1 Tax=Hymenobacter sp. BRD67 TaxID=2675877 RepID=UPI0020B65F42|nr:FAD-binding oxidoreductase [Hymenobacter sp. BRD67]